jgi:glycosyltransferase involved in cell wall biosynthesis
VRILIVVPEQDCVSGNWVSALRFQQGLEQLRHQVHTISVSLAAGPDCRKKVIDFAPDVALLLHAFRAGKPWLESAGDLGIPFVIMLTGTDINLGLADPEQKAIIADSIKQAAFVLLQNPLLATNFLKTQPELALNLRTINAATILGKAPYSLRERHGLDKEIPLFLYPAGIRPIKRQRELLSIFDDAVAEGHFLQLVFCGPFLDQNYSEAFMADIAERPWASYLGVIATNAMASAMRKADVIVNNSLAEGLPNSLVEAATLGIPILASHNLGNAAVVKENVNGLLYSHASECLEKIRSLLNPAKRSQLSCPDKSYNLEAEASSLEEVLMAARRSFPPSANK